MKLRTKCLLTKDATHFVVSLTYFYAMFPINTPWKHQKNFGFLVFSGSIKWEHWTEINWFHWHQMGSELSGIYTLKFLIWSFHSYQVHHVKESLDFWLSYHTKYSFDSCLSYHAKYNFDFWVSYHTCCSFLILQYTGPFSYLPRTKQISNYSGIVNN